MLSLASPRCMDISCFRRRCMNFETGKIKEVRVRPPPPGIGDGCPRRVSPLNTNVRDE